MDRSAVKKVIEANIKDLLEKLGLPHWDIKIELGPIEGGATGQCGRKIDYNQAYVELDPELLDDEEHVLKVLRHELFHVVLSPYDLYERAVANAGLSDDMDRVLGRIWTHAMEKAVINLERLFSGLTARPPEPPPGPPTEPPIDITDGPPAIS
jgi:hypothetical protein